MRKLFKLLVLSYVSMTLAMLAWTFLWPISENDDFETADAIVCLGGGMSANGTLAPPVLTRIERCVQLFDAGVAPRIVFTGGTAVADGPDAGTQMAAYAASLGLPDTAVIVEDSAQSTLHNALFSIDLIPDASNVILVSEAFHLPRSWLSFKWAAWEAGHGELNIELAMSENVRRNPSSGEVHWAMLGRESIAIWFNLVRAAAYSVAPDPDVSWLN